MHCGRERSCEPPPRCSQIVHASDFSRSKLRLLLTFDQGDLSRSPTVPLLLKLLNSFKRFLEVAGFVRFAIRDATGQPVGGSRGVFDKLHQTAEASCAGLTTTFNDPRRTREMLDPDKKGGHEP